MESRILAIDADNPQPELLEQAAKVIRHGGVVVGPTDTVYGLFCDPANELAIRRIYEIKGRDFRRPLILLIADIESTHGLCAEMPELARKAMQQFWPGPLTIILPKNAAVPQYLTAGGETIGLRIPNHPVTVGLLKKTGPLASTSANRSGEPAALSAGEIVATLRGQIDLIIDSGPSPIGVESSVVDFSREIPRLLREGYISRQALEEVLGRLG